MAEKPVLVYNWTSGELFAGALSIPAQGFRAISYEDFLDNPQIETDVEATFGLELRNPNKPLLPQYALIDDSRFLLEAQKTLLTGGSVSDADSLHTHPAKLNANNTTQLLTQAQKTALTGGSSTSADAQHTHPAKANTIATGLSEVGTAAHSLSTVVPAHGLGRTPVSVQLTIRAVGGTSAQASEALDSIIRLGVRAVDATTLSFLFSKTIHDSAVTLYVDWLAY